MKIIHYCQYIWGVGHFFRTLEICRALAGHEVILVAGGPEVDVDLPDHVQPFRLPGLMTDRNYDGLFPTDAGRTLEAVRRERKQRLYDLFEQQRPDALIIELYPFGRKAFRFELDPVLDGIRSGRLHRTRVFCSLRDILVEKSDPIAYEARVVKTLNRYFDAVLIHADPSVVAIDQTFSRIRDLKVPIVYTGYIAARPPTGAGRALRKQLGIEASDRLVVASAGSGKAGIVLLEPLLEAAAHLEADRRLHLQMFTGPFMPEEEFQSLASRSNQRVTVRRFTARFLSHLTAADLSVSMGGYNTTMNILATGVPALIWPYPGDREQGLRAAAMAQLGAAGVIRAQDLHPKPLAELMRKKMIAPGQHRRQIDLDGAHNTARWIDSAVAG
jgi:predicted glycosyltransferase